MHDENGDSGNLVHLEHTIWLGGASCRVVQRQGQDIEETVAAEVADWVAYSVLSVTGQHLAYQCMFFLSQTSQEAHNGEIQPRGHIGVLLRVTPSSLRDCNAII